MMVKQLAVVLSLSVLMTACGGSDNKKSSSSSSSSKASSVASSAAVSSVASSAAVSSVVSSAVSSVAVSSSSSSEVVVISSSSSSSAASSEVSSSSSVASSSSSSSAGENAENCEPNPDSVINTCDTAKWVVDGGNGGSITFGELGPIFTNGKETGTESYNVPGMFYKMEDPVVNASIVGKTFTLVLMADQAFKDSAGYIQLFIQQNGGSYGGTYCDTTNADIIVGQEFTMTCKSGAAPANGVASIRLGFQLKNATSYLGTLEVKDATLE